MSFVIIEGTLASKVLNTLNEFGFNLKITAFFRAH